ncbi:TadE/TadG family type IV pilus assembly protein [Aureimonas flava]|nr:TadE/TadG family type IV pilus assembly protein [Aureimonas flava]
MRRRFAQDRSGVAALEFALVVPIFLALVFSTIEAGWIMVRSISLDRALDLAVRKVRINTADAPASQPQMKTAICANMGLVVPVCEKAMIVEMSVVKTASDIPTTSATCLDRGSSYEPSVTFTTGDRAQVLFVRACLVADPITPLMGLALRLPKDSLGGYSIVSSSAFMNEPSGQ